MFCLLRRSSSFISLPDLRSANLASVKSNSFRRIRFAHFVPAIWFRNLGLLCVEDFRRAGVATHCIRRGPEIVSVQRRRIAVGYSQPHQFDVRLPILRLNRVGD